MGWDNEPLGEHELGQLLDAASGMSLATEFTVRLTAATGMRPSEVAHMRASWFERSADVVSVPEHEPCNCSDCVWKAKQSSRRSVNDYWQPKNTAAARRIPVQSSEASGVLQDFFNENAEVGVTRQTVKNRIESAAEEAGLEARVKPIVLRHTYGVMAASSGLNEEALREVMGHDNLAAVRVYFEYADG